MVCAVTALPILILLMEKLEILRANWAMGGSAVFIVAAVLLIASVSGKLAGILLLDKQIITSETFTALLLMAIGSTMLTVPMVYPKLQRVAQLIFKTS